MKDEIEIKFTEEELVKFVDNLKEINRTSEAFTFDSRVIISRLQMYLDIYKNEKQNIDLKERIELRMCYD